MVIIAVPCDHHEKLEYQEVLLIFSIKKQSGAAISSRLIPPNVPPMFLIVSIMELVSLLLISISIESISANLLKDRFAFHWF